MQKIADNMFALGKIQIGIAGMKVGGWEKGLS